MYNCTLTMLKCPPSFSPSPRHASSRSIKCSAAHCSAIASDSAHLCCSRSQRVRSEAHALLSFLVLVRPILRIFLVLPYLSSNPASRLPLHSSQVITCFLPGSDDAQPTMTSAGSSRARKAREITLVELACSPEGPGQREGG